MTFYHSLQLAYQYHVALSRRDLCNGIEGTGLVRVLFR